MAYEAYLRGNFALNQMTPEGFERGLALLEEAVERDPASPLPYAGLARGYSLLASHTPDPPPGAFDRARDAYRQALELAAGREADARRVAAELAADPDPLDALSLVVVHAALGEFDQAARWLAFEPPHPWVPWLRTWPLLGPFRDDPRFGRRMEELGLYE